MTPDELRQHIARDGLTSGQVARRLGVSRETIKNYLHVARVERAAGRDRPGLMPEPDYTDPLSGWNYWLPASIDAWEAARVGAGNRPDWAAIEAARTS